MTLVKVNLERIDMPTLYLIRGLPGSGKSSLAQKLADQLPNTVYFEADEWMYDENLEYKFDPTKLKSCHEQCQLHTRGSLEFGLNVVVSNTSTTEKEVTVYQKIAEECGAHFISLIAENRHGGKNIHNVPDEKLQQMKQRFSIKL
jgi:predicted kinase